MQLPLKRFGKGPWASLPGQPRRGSTNRPLPCGRVGRVLNSRDCAHCHPAHVQAPSTAHRDQRVNRASPPAPPRAPPNPGAKSEGTHTHPHHCFTQ